MHELLGALEGKPPVKPGDDYFLMPIAIHAVSEGDHELWDGATRFTQSSTLRHQTGDRVRVLDGDVWCDGVVIRQPANDGAPEAYDVKLTDGRRVFVPDDDEEVITAGEPRRVHHFEIVFGGFKMRTPHDEALGAMGAFGRDVQLASSAGPPEICGRCVRQLAGSVFEEATEALYEACVEASAQLLGVEVPDDWREQRQHVARQHAEQVRTAMGIQCLTSAHLAASSSASSSSSSGSSAALQSGPPGACDDLGSGGGGGGGGGGSGGGGSGGGGSGGGGSGGRKRARSSSDVDRAGLPFHCPAPGCHRAYAVAASLYQHKRAHHPELLPQQPEPAPGKRGRGRPLAGTLNEDQRFGCPAPGCMKIYASSAGLYQHKRAHHPELINRRQ
jgi:hypothetical protein